MKVGRPICFKTVHEWKKIIIITSKKKKKRRKKAPSITRGNEIRGKKNCVCHATDLGQERGTAPRLCRIPVDSEGGNFEKNACEM